MAVKEYEAQHVGLELPITLRICQESRAETLNHYTFFRSGQFEALRSNRSALGHTTRGEKVILNPRRDQVHLSWNFVHRPFVFEIVREMQAKLPKYFNAITSIDLREYLWRGNHGWTDPPQDALMRLRSSTPHFDIIDTSGLNPSELWGGFLHLFPGLTTVHITQCRPKEHRTEPEDLNLSAGDQREDFFGLEAARDHIAEVLALGKDGFLSGKVPDVVIRPWKCLPGVD